DQTLSDKRQNRRVGELKQEQAGAKDKQSWALPQARAACPRGRIGRVVMGSSAGAAEGNIGCMDAGERNEKRKCERGDPQENGPIGESIPNQAHDCGCDETACGGKALVASKPFGQRRMSHQAKTDRSDRRPQYPAGDSL